MPAFPIFGGRKAWLNRLFCCASAPEGDPPASLTGAFNVGLLPGATGDGFGFTFTGALPMTIAAPDAPAWFDIIDNGDGTFAIGYADTVEGLYEFDIVATNAYGSHAVPATLTVTAWVEFQLTVGAAAPYNGYLTPGMLGAVETIGAVAPEPHPVHIARALVDAHPGGYILVFAGDCAAKLDASVFVIDGIECAPLSAAIYDGGQDVTQWQVDSAPGPRFLPDGIHYCRVLPA